LRSILANDASADAFANIMISLNIKVRDEYMAAASTRLVNYSSTFLLLEYSLLLFLIANFHFPLQFSCSQLMNCWNLWKLWASRFHLQLASLVTIRPIIWM